MQDKIMRPTVAQNRIRPRSPIVATARVGPRNIEHTQCAIDEDVETKNHAEIQVEKQGERIDALIIKCACGEEIRVSCNYTNVEE